MAACQHDDDPLPPPSIRVVLHRCSACAMSFVGHKDAAKHVALPKCRGARVLSLEYGVVGPGLPPKKRKRQETVDLLNGAASSAGSARATVTNGTMTGNINVANSIDQSVHIDSLVVVVAPGEGDLARAGSVLESELIRKIIIEDGALRRSIRTIENAPLAIFNSTKGKGGPRVLRNVTLAGNKAREVREDGESTTALIEYCKKTAVHMVDELRVAIASVDDSSPVAVREWARDVRKALHEPTCGGLDYVRALRLYCDASSKFYKLPKTARESIAEGVRGIRHVIAPDRPGNA